MFDLACTPSRQRSMYYLIGFLEDLYLIRHLISIHQCIVYRIVILMDIMLSCSFDLVLPVPCSNCSRYSVSHWIECSIMPIFHFPLLRSSPLITTTFLTAGSVTFGSFFMLCLSRKALKYSCYYLRHTASLHLIIFFCLFLRSQSSIFSESSSGIDLPSCVT